MGKIKRLFEIISKEGVCSLYDKFIGKIKSREFFQLLNDEKWEEAIEMGTNLISIFPENVDYSRKLAECYQKVNKHEQAHKLIQSYMGFNYDLNEIIEISRKEINELIIESNYRQLGGTNNDGLIEHTPKDSSKKYLTKITRSKHKEIEKLFFEKVYKFYAGFKKITPEFVGLIEIKKVDLYLITMRKIDGVKPELNDKSIHKVGKISKVISSTKYDEISKWFPLNTDKSDSEIHNLLWSFESIHKESVNIELFKYQYKKMETLDYSSESISLIEQLEGIIMDNKLYKKVQPMKHYTIQHGDFFRKNLLSEDDKVYVVDWGCMKVGPSWCDMAGFLGDIRYPFHKVQSDYLLNSKVSSHMEPIEKLFFIYTLVMVWITEFGKEEFDESHDTYLSPAVELIEMMARDIVVDRPKQTQEIQLNHLESNISI